MLHESPKTPDKSNILVKALDQEEILTAQKPELAVIDLGYHRHGVGIIHALTSGSKRGLKSTLRKLLQRCSAIEPEVGHMKTDNRLVRYPLKGLRIDAIFAVLFGYDHNSGRS